jgi:hypothetical protein
LLLVVFKTTNLESKSALSQLQVLFQDKKSKVYEYFISVSGSVPRKKSGIKECFV